MKVEYNIVLGCPRSGTTFLMKCLDALPDSEVVSGILLPSAIPHIVNHALSPEIYEALSSGFKLSLKGYLDSIREARVPSIARWFRGCMDTQELIQALQSKRTIKRMVYKEPFLSFAPEFTYNALPNCRIVHICRDGRDSADSQVRTYDVLTDESLKHLRHTEMILGRKYDHHYIPWWVEEGREAEFLGCTPYVRAIWMWKEMVRRCHDFFSRPEIAASGRIMLVKYEDLVSDPLKYGESVVEHFGCKMNNRLRTAFQQASTQSIGVYRRRDAKEIEIAEKIAKVELELYRYL